MRTYVQELANKAGDVSPKDRLRLVREQLDTECPTPEAAHLALRLAADTGEPPQRGQHHTYLFAPKYTGPVWLHHLVGHKGLDVLPKEALEMFVRTKWGIDGPGRIEWRDHWHGYCETLAGPVGVKHETIEEPGRRRFVVTGERVYYGGEMWLAAADVPALLEMADGFAKMSAAVALPGDVKVLRIERRRIPAPVAIGWDFPDDMEPREFKKVAIQNGAARIGFYEPRSRTMYFATIALKQ